MVSGTTERLFRPGSGYSGGLDRSTMALAATARSRLRISLITQRVTSLPIGVRREGTSLIQAEGQDRHLAPPSPERFFP
jgi:hypothetical protein